MAVATVPEAIADMKAGKFITVVHDEAHESEGDLVVAAELVTPEHISFMTHGVRKIRLLTNNPKKIDGLEGFGLEVVERVPIRITSNPDNERYLHTKRDKLGHLL